MMLVRSERVARLAPNLGNDAQSKALGLWDATIQRTGRFRRTDILPERFGAAMSYICRIGVVDAEREEPEFTLIREGDLVERFFGRSAPARFSDVFTPSYRLSVEPRYALAARSYSPDYGFFAAEDRTGRVYTFTQLMLPIEDPSGGVCEIMAVFDLRLPPSHYPSGPLSIHLPLRQMQDAARRRVLARASLGYREI